MSDDDESFVILGTSPIMSLDMSSGAQSAFQSLCESQIQVLSDGLDKSKVTLVPDVETEKLNVPQADAQTVRNSNISDLDMTCNMQTSGDTNSSKQSSIRAGADVIVESEGLDKPKVTVVPDIQAEKLNVPQSDAETAMNTNISDLGMACNMQTSGDSKSSKPSSIRSGAGDASLAASFILGEINADVLKTSVYSQFPSLCSMEPSAEDMVKLQTFMADHIELKNTLAKVNVTMKQFYTKTQLWRDEVSTMKARDEQKIIEFQKEIAQLRNENQQLKNAVETNIKELQISDEIRRQDHAEMVQSISAKTAQIENMRAVIEKLEQEQLVSYECVNNLITENKTKPDYVDRVEHGRVIKEFERKMSTLLAENLDLKDLQKHYIDEITCLKVNLTAAQELINLSRRDIKTLQATDVEQCAALKEYQTTRDQMRDEIAVLSQQVDIYRKDFEMERVARENIAGEKDQILNDLRNLQQKNQKLIEDAKLRLAQQVEQNGAAALVDVPIMKSVATSTTGTIPKTITLPVKHTAVAATFTASEAQIPIRALPNSQNIMSAAQATPTTVHCCPICFKTVSTLTLLQSHVNECLDKNN